MFFKVLKERLKNIGLKATKGQFDSECMVNDQTQLINYDKIWEFPRHKLTLGNIE